jgi:hypothetical protein
MNILEIMLARHSVRRYNNKEIEAGTIKTLEDCIATCNQESGLHIQLCLHQPDAFMSMKARYGKFENVQHYIALVGKKEDSLQEKVGYYGERIVLQATKLHLGTCWVGGTYNKNKCHVDIADNEKLVCVISLGYFDHDGVPHKTKSIEALSKITDSMPSWFMEGMKAVQLAPTALNQQKFVFSLNGTNVSAKAKIGPYTKLDLGIVKYHFELGAGKHNFTWL